MGSRSFWICMKRAGAPRPDRRNDGQREKPAAGNARTFGGLALQPGSAAVRHHRLQGRQSDRTAAFPGRLLPHCCAELNNVAENGVERSLIYLRQECERRQRYFAQAQTALKQPVSDLDHYRQLCLDHPQLPRLAHCVLIIDEFAELKQSQPEFMQDLIQICRIGRSLGLHLIL